MSHPSKLKTSFKIKKLRTIYILYWFLLTYIIAALIWWFIALSQQNKMMTDYKLSELNSAQPDYQNQLAKINDEKHRKTGQYIGEGITFFLLIIVGAVLVFRAVRRQFRQSQQQQNFMMAITHELKTPIAITKLNLETLQKHKLAESQQQQLISNTLQEAGRMNTLCNNLLLASQIEAGDYKLTIERIDIGELIAESANDFKMRFPKRIINLDTPANIYLNGDRLLLQMAVNNLIDNAIKYSGKEEKIEVQLKKENDEIKFFIKDEGKGIPDKEKDKIFTKFYRVGNLHTKEAKGTGLGLYLSKKIIEQHNGYIIVTDNKPQGSIFEIKL
ncbi:MAG TPA: ATP-binding protein [Chitinophagaceae bacterium]|nr:ATP-binding protein [Chitinophagaceae bacterium]